ncbi:MAG: DUF4013 domain-containing protein [Gemmataceae bacterium]|nr:DUF4013 domain-containing protein [Gemmataceae bacterium]
MSTQTDIPQVLPAQAVALPTALPAAPVRSVWGSWPLRWGRALVGWAWRLAVGAAMCFNTFVLSYFTSILALGWTYRWMQVIVLRGWWKRSPKREQGSFADFCDSLGPNAPAPRPRWFLRERIGAVMSQPGPGGRPASALRLFWRAVTVPWYSLWLNFKTGLAAAICTYLLTGSGCLLMFFGWEYGWLNSFNRHYEQAFVGLTAWLLGALMLVVALFYVPMAQAHQAATGQARAFFDFRFVWQLIRARLTAYVGLAMLIWLAAVAVSGVVIPTVSEEFMGNDRTLTAEEGFLFYWQYLAWFTLLLLFPLFLLLRLVAALIYRSAVLKALRQGTVLQADLNPVLAGWLDRLQLRILPQAETTGLGWYARLTTRFAYRRVLFTVLFFVWLFFATRFLVAYFFRSHPVVGYLNHPMIQLPCFDFMPDHLYQGRNE